MTDSRDGPGTGTVSVSAVTERPNSLVTWSIRRQTKSTADDKLRTSSGSDGLLYGLVIRAILLIIVREIQLTIDCISSITAISCVYNKELRSQFL